MATTRGYQVVVAPAAIAAVETALRRWHRHRLASPDLLARELSGMLGVIERAPRVGRHVRGTQFRGVRRLLLRRSGFHIYYQVDETMREIKIVHFRYAGRRPLGRL